jgi:hypothetical protein
MPFNARIACRRKHAACAPPARPANRTGIRRA